MHLLVFYRGHRQTNQLVGRDPYGQHAPCRRYRPEGADPQANDLQAVLVGEQPAERFAEDLAHRVAAVRPGFSAGAQPVAAPVVSDHMMRTREYHPTDAVVAHRLKQVYDRAYVVSEHWRPVVLLGCARHMHDGVDSLGDAAGELGVCEGRSEEHTY